MMRLSLSLLPFLAATAALANQGSPTAGANLDATEPTPYDGTATGTIYQIATQADFDQYSGATFQAGDQILFQRGSIFNGMFSPTGSGAENNPIRISTYGTGPMPVINANGEHEAAILILNQEFWEIEGIEVTNTDGSDVDQGDLKGIFFKFTESDKEVLSHIHVENCYVHDVNALFAKKRRGGIQVQVLDEGDDPFRLDDVRIVGNTIMNVGGIGIGNSSDFGRIDEGLTDQLWTNVYVAHNYIDTTGRNNIIARDSRDAIYEYNLLANSSRADTGHSIYNFSTIGIVMQHNEAYGNVGESGEVDRGGFDADWDAEGTIIQYNYSHDNHWFCGIMRRYNKDVTIRYNISQNELLAFYFFGFAFEDAAGLEHAHVHNNVHFVGPDKSGPILIFYEPGVNTTFSNNIFYFGDRGIGRWNRSALAQSENVSFSGNLYYNITPPVTGDPFAVEADPLFVAPGSGEQDIDMTDPDRLAGYRLQRGSPAIDSGMFIEGVERDFWGHPVAAGAGMDIGVHEHQNPSWWTGEGLRQSAESFEDEPGIGWIEDSQWPFLYTYGIGNGTWIWIMTSNATRNGFFAYDFTNRQWLWGSNAWGWYYTFGSGQGWQAFKH